MIHKLFKSPITQPEPVSNIIHPLYTLSLTCEYHTHTQEIYPLLNSPSTNSLLFSDLENPFKYFLEDDRNVQGWCLL